MREVWCIRERNGKEGGGKGLLIQKEVSNTIATSNDQFILVRVTRLELVPHEDKDDVNHG